MTYHPIRDRVFGYDQDEEEEEEDEKQEEEDEDAYKLPGVEW